jgi:hypothetical protein
MNNDFEKYRKVYSFEIPKDVLFEWLVELGWGNASPFGVRSVVVEFVPISDPEDSYFNVNGSDNNQKTSLAEAIKLAYFKYQDGLKDQRREMYEELKKEFESADPGEASK